MVGYLGIALLMVNAWFFLKLAKKHGKKEQRFALLGALTYQLGFLAGNRIITFIPSDNEAEADLLLVAAYLIGIACSATLHTILETRWTKERSRVTLDDDIIDSDFVQ